MLGTLTPQGNDLGICMVPPMLMHNEHVDLKGGSVATHTMAVAC